MRAVMMRSAYILLFMGALLLGGCDRTNGLPQEITKLLAGHGITITATRTHSSLSSRGGYIVAQYSTQVASSIISEFKLQKIQPDDRQWKWVCAKTDAEGVKELWGVLGRPVQFKLKNGSQFEYFYLLITEGGLMYLVAEYAYG